MCLLCPVSSRDSCRREAPASWLFNLGADGEVGQVIFEG